MKDKRGRLLTVGCLVAVAFYRNDSTYDDACYVDDYSAYLNIGTIIEVKDDCCKIKLSEEDYIYGYTYVCCASDQIIIIE